MKILQINDKGVEGGGAETNVFGIHKFIKNTSLFAFGSETKKTNNLYIYKHPKNNIFQRFFFSFKIYKELKKHIKKLNPDLIHLHNNYQYSNTVLLAIKHSKIPTIQTVHDWGLICPTAWYVYKHNLKECSGCKGISLKCLKCISLKHFLLIYLRNKIRFNLSKKVIKYFISPSIKLKKDMKKYKFNITCLHHFLEFKTNLDLNKVEKNLILYVGVLTKNKGVIYLIKAFKIIKKQIPSAKLIIIGGRNKEIEKHASKDIKFLGKIPHKELIKYYKKANVIVMPSIWMENSPFVAYETLSSGRPMVASKRGGIPDLVINNKTGLLTEPASPKDIAKKTLTILNNKTLFNKLAKNAKDYIETKLNKEIYIKKLNLIYKKWKK